MEARMEGIMNRMTSIKSTLINMQLKMDENHEKLIAMLTKNLGQKQQEDGEKNPKHEATPEGSGRKVKLPMLSGDGEETHRKKLGPETERIVNVVAEKMVMIAGESHGERRAGRLSNMEVSVKRRIKPPPAPEPPDSDLLVVATGTRKNKDLEPPPTRTRKDLVPPSPPEPPDASPHAMETESNSAKATVTGSIAVKPPFVHTRESCISVAVVGSVLESLLNLRLKESPWARTLEGSNLMKEEDRRVILVIWEIGLISDLMGLPQVENGLWIQETEILDDLSQSLVLLGPIQDKPFEPNSSKPPLLPSLVRTSSPIQDPISCDPTRVNSSKPPLLPFPVRTPSPIQDPSSRDPTRVSSCGNLTKGCALQLLVSPSKHTLLQFPVCTPFPMRTFQVRPVTQVEPKAKNPNKMDMGFEEQHKLGVELLSLLPEKLEQRVQVRRHGHWKIDENSDLATPHYARKGFLSREQLPETNAEKTSLLLKSMTKVSNLDYFSNPQSTTVKGNCNFVVDPTNVKGGRYEFSSNSVMVQVGDHAALIVFREGVERPSNTEMLLEENGGIQVVERDLDWLVYIILSSEIGLACYDRKNLLKKATPTTEASSSWPSSINMSTDVLALPSFSFGGCFMVFDGEFNILSNVMESSEVLYAATTSLGFLQIFFSYSPELTNEVISCIKSTTILIRGMHPKMSDLITLAELFLKLSSWGRINESPTWSHEQWVDVFEKYHVPEGGLSLLSVFGKCGDIQVKDEWVRKYKKEVVAIMHEYFLSYDILELIQSLEDLGAHKYTPIFLKKLITLAMIGKNKEKEMVSALLSVLHIQIVAMEDIVNGFVMLLEIAEDGALDTWNASSELTFFLARAVIADVPTSLNLEKSNCSLPPKGSGIETVQRARLLEAGSSSSQQWDPGGKGLIFNDYSTRRVFGRNSMSQYLIQWKGKALQEATWEDEVTILSQISPCQPWGQGCF